MQSQSSLIRSLSLVLVALLLLSGLDLRAQASKRDLIKAAYVYQFSKLVYYPHEDQLKEFVICVLNSDKMAEHLSSATKLVKFRDRLPIRVVKIRSTDEIRNCQMLVVDGSKGENLWAAYSKIRGKGVLMVAENLSDYKKSMISFTEVDGSVKYIINKTKVEESNLVFTERLYRGAITKEGEWKSIMDKIADLMKNGDKEIRLDKDDLKQMVSMYKNLEEEKKSKEAIIAQMEDSLSTKMETLKRQMLEAEKVSKRIEEQKEQMANLDLQIKDREKEISSAQKIIGEQKTVISIIALLSVIGIILLLFSIRSNAQRRKANKLLMEQKAEVEKQKHLVDEKQKEILDSINYAKRIQTALMANSKILNENVPEHFVIFKPKDIVAGDFYWAAEVGDSFMYITADSTGHGVPGAFMSLLNITKLNEAVNQKRLMRPDHVLNDVKKGIIKALNPDGVEEESKDGMDATLCRIDRRNLKLQFAAANNSFCIVRNNEVITCKADKMPVGKSHDDHAMFTFNEITLEKGDMIYTFTDGYGDQFGGPEGKKFKHKQLRDIFREIAPMPIQKQREVLNHRFENWKGQLEQVDDVLVIGVRV